MFPINHLNFSDPYISRSPNFNIDSLRLTPSIDSTSLITNTEIQSQQINAHPPVVATSPSGLSDHTIIVYRIPLGTCNGPNLSVEVLKLKFENSQSHPQIHASCTSTYPNTIPYLPIADRYEVRLFKDGWILTLADGCGLGASSRQAPLAAMEGFWTYLTDKLKNDQEGFKTQKLAQYIYEAIQAGHLNIYWDAYKRSNDGSDAHFLQMKDSYDSLFNSPINAQEIENKREGIKAQWDLYTEAMNGNRAYQKKLMERDLHKNFFQNYAGATTFLCSALVKTGSASNAPYYLISVNLGDCKGYLYRNGKVFEITKDSREDISNARDPGGKIGLCTPVPLLMDTRNLQYSSTPCFSKDTLFFMTDGVVDNLDPERLGLLPNATNSPQSVLNKIQQSGCFTDDEFASLLKILEQDVYSWGQLSLEEGNKIKSEFAIKLLEQLIQKSAEPRAANENIIQFCQNITSEYRNHDSSNSDAFAETPLFIGKPDHTTCLTISVP